MDAIEWELAHLQELMTTEVLDRDKHMADMQSSLEHVHSTCTTMDHHIHTLTSKVDELESSLDDLHDAYEDQQAELCALKERLSAIETLARTKTSTNLE